MDEILLHETQKVSVAREAPEFLDPDYDENKIYQVKKMSLEETKDKIELRKLAFEHKHKCKYGIDNQNDMTHIHKKEVNKIAE